MKLSARKALDIIQADEKLLSWARYSIRYNKLRMHQANDFISKINAHKIEIPGGPSAIQGALAQLEKEDKE